MMCKTLVWSQAQKTKNQKLHLTKEELVIDLYHLWHPRDKIHRAPWAQTCIRQALNLTTSFLAIRNIFVTLEVQKYVGHFCSTMCKNWTFLYCRLLDKPHSWCYYTLDSYNYNFNKLSVAAGGQRLSLKVVTALSSDPGIQVALDLAPLIPSNYSHFTVYTMEKTWNSNPYGDCLRICVHHLCLHPCV